MASLQSLPVELLLHIHLLALSPSLPLVSSHIHISITNNTSPLYRAGWIHAKLANEGISLAPSISRHKKGSKIAQYFSHALRFPICDSTVMGILEESVLDTIKKQTEASYRHSMRIVEEAIRATPPALPTIPSTSSRSVLPPDKVFESLHPAGVTLQAHIPRMSVEVPKRLFRRLLSCPPASTFASADRKHTAAFDAQDSPLLLHILDELNGNPDSHKGYALAKAVLSRHLGLIGLLLKRGADPGVKNAMSIMLAIGRNDVQIVKMLIEREVLSEQQEETQSTYAGGESQMQNKKKRKRQREALQESSPGKRRKVEDRVPVTSAMLELAVRQQCEPLIQYFMGKGAVPNTKTLGMLQG